MIIFWIDGAWTQLELEAPGSFDEVLRRRAMLLDWDKVRKSWKSPKRSQISPTAATENSASCPKVDCRC